MGFSHEFVMPGLLPLICRLESYTFTNMMDDSDTGSISGFTKLRRFIQQRFQKVLDDVTPYILPRWVFAALILVVFCARVFILQGWYIVAYAVGIYHLNLFIAFISPQIDPALDFEDESGPSLPTRANEEFRPFIRRLPEFKFWYSVCKSTLFSILCTFFDVFNIPVFWPILVLYFITLFGITMKRQIKHMIRYRYVPYTYGKPKYQGHEDSGKVANPDSTRQSDSEDVKKNPLTDIVSKPTLPLLTPSNVV